MDDTVHKPDRDRDIFDIIADNLMWWLLYLFFPPVWIDREVSVLQRFWRWRYVYLGFALAWTVLISENLLAGEYSLLGLFFLFHVYAVLLSHTYYETGGLADYGAVGLPPGPALGLAIAIGLLTVILEFAWRRPNHDISLVGPDHTPDEDELAVPLDRVDNWSDGAPSTVVLDGWLSTAIIGTTGSGKTTAMKLLAHQFPDSEETAVICHETGQDFRRYYEKQGIEVLELSVDGGDVVWNLFRDIERERDCREIAGAVFGAEPSGKNPFFGPAKQVFEAILIHLWRTDDELEKHDVGHDDVVELLNKNPEDLYETLQKYDDLQSQVIHLDPDAGRSTRNVYQTLHEYTDRVFVGDFARHGEFSLREYLETPGDRVVVIRSAVHESETLGPIYRLLVDWTIRFGFESETEANFILDEVDHLPELSMLPELAARGRSEGVRALIGVQTVGQLQDVYGEKGANSVLGNCTQGLYFEPGDRPTTQYILSELGKERQSVASRTVEGSGLAEPDKSRTISQQDRHPITSAKLRQFEPGNAVVTRKGAWWIGQVAEFSDIVS
jgi:energy-coupling factor transporter ATP-binding protein EcfA2